MKHIWRRFRPVKQKSVTTAVGDTTDLLKQLFERTPGAVRAQRSMDNHPGTYHTNNKAKLYELIDFNDTFVALALSLSSEQRTGFIERLKQQMTDYCASVGSPMFSDEQFDAITRGLTREVAVYLGAKQQGYEVRMTSRTQDALGVDMVITDPATGKSINVDCKTSSAYHFRLKDLVQQGRLQKTEAERAELDGYAHEVNGHGREAVAVTILRIDPNEVGDITDITFDEPRLLGQKLRAIFVSF